MMINKTVDKFVNIIILVALFVAFIPTVLTSIINLSTISDLPLVSLFAADGIVPLILGVYVFYAVISHLAMGKGRK